MISTKATIIGAGVVVLAIAVVGFGIPYASANEEHTPAPATGTPNAFNQNRMDAIANQITGPGFEQGDYRPGFGGISLDVGSGTITLAWQGQVPSDVERIISTAPRDITIHIVASKYSRAELWKATQQVNNSRQTLQAQGWQISAQLDPLGNGLSVGIKSSQDHPQTSQDQAEEAIRQAAGVDVVFTDSVPVLSVVPETHRIS